MQSSERQINVNRITDEPNNRGHDNNDVVANGKIIQN